mgnify:CR=1 FL=1
MSILEGYLNSLNLHVSEKTILAYRETIEKFLAYNKSREIDKTGAEEFLTYISLHGCSARSMNRHLSAIRSFFSYMGLQLGLRSYKFPKNLPVYLTEEEAKRMVSVARNPLEDAVVKVFLGTGIRLSELLSLTPKDIDPEGYITVLGKGSKQRVVAVQPEIIELLNRFARGKFPEELIFLYHRTTIQKTVQRMADRAGIKRNISPHKLRHSYASLFLRHGGQIADLRDQLGHSNITVTNIYIHTTASDRKKNLPKTL